MAYQEHQDPFSYNYRDTRDLVRMVNQAADLFAKEGKASFEAFARPDSRWLMGERFIFIFDEKGVCVFHPRHPLHVGKNMINVRDFRGRPYHRWIVNIAKNQRRPYGWVHYLSPPPQGLYPMWKSSYVVGVRGPDGKRYAIGSGRYNMRPEKRFIEDLVNRAVELIDRKGTNAFPILRDEAEQYNLLGSYIYVLTPEGRLAVDPAYPSGTQRNVLDYRDAVGNQYIRDLIERLNKCETARVMYLWPKAGEETLSKKLIFARRVEVGNETYIVGSDLFLSTPIWLHF